MKKLYDSVGLTPYLALFLHLVILGLPFGRWVKRWMDDPCSLFHDKVECSASELFSLNDFVVRYLLFYNQAWVVWLLMRTSTTISVAFHKILLGTSILTLLSLAYVQPELISGRRGPLNPDFSFHLAVCYGAACLLSAWTIQVHPKAVTESMKWSIPANAIFWGAVINLFVAVASFQALTKESGVAGYYHDKTTPAILLSFTLGAMFTFIHSILLLRIRTFLTVSQLRSVCFYKVVVNLVLLFLWMPEMNSSIMKINKKIALAIRISVTSTYLFGFLWAGKAEGVSRILTSEKED